MKRFVTRILISIVAVMVAGVLPTIGKPAASRRTIAVVNFKDEVKLMDVSLKGIYLFEHDDDRMARGEDCTRVYLFKEKNPKPWQFVTSFHCIPIERKRVDRFTLSIPRSEDQSGRGIREIQFMNTAEGHRVP